MQFSKLIRQLTPDSFYSPLPLWAERVTYS
jgi:hypothetical protein